MAHTLLLADDSITIQRIIELTFADEAVQVVAVSTGEEAIAVLNRTPPDIVLADVGMPRPGGYEIARYIKDAAELAHIPVVLLTGAFEPVDEARAAAAGCDAVLAKPFAPQLVIGCVRKLLASSRSRAPSAPDASPLPSTRSRLPTPAAGPPPPAKPARSEAQPSGDDLSEYFDRLDQAFANAAAPKAAGGASAPLDHEGDWIEEPASILKAPAAGDRWTDDQGLDLPDLPQSSPPPSAEADSAVRRAASSPVRPVHTSRRPQDRPPFPESAHPSALGPQVDGGGQQSAAPAWPSGTATPSLPGDLVERVTRRVLERLSETGARDAVRDAVRSVVERLVREEIERIKSNIK